ncbi:ACP S-malonyltransferase [Saccharothrix sp. BKS2]|uniref:[acyl-carrier-protein] S-malonyltransferase n=1 Tax=Saccharothrix lopnurensis TaxID=1670621 RepID=A0ABW1P4W3_9PSEU
MNDVRQVDGFGIAFPGQGTKREAMVEALRRHHEHPLVAEFHAVVGTSDVGSLDFMDTAVAQPATYVAGIAAVEGAFGQLIDVPLVLGHSLGELTAAACAGVVDVWSGFALAVRRGELCRDHAVRTPGAMVAVMGAEADGIEWLRRQVLVCAGRVIEVAGINGRGQTVLSGDPESVKEVIRLAEDEGLKTNLLPIRGSFHSPLMIDVIAEWRDTVEAVEFREGAGTFVSTIDARVHSDPAEIRELLVRALLLPVRWREAVHTARQHGALRLWDAGPGDTLHKLGKREKIVDFAPLDPRPV